ncbi:MAG TPA: hypothetical protein VIT23_15270 [Terrimicrobiaceae bacterium]
MSKFLKSFLHEGQGLFSRKTKAQAYLGAFGKHPGWDDHIDDIGLETESLLLAKQILYVDGIGGQINSGDWEKLGEQQRLAEFKHIFAWKRGNAFLLGKIWSSRDGKNRTQYPMIVCAHFQGIFFESAVAKVLQTLDSVEYLCKSTSSAEEVRNIIQRTREELRQSFVGVDNPPYDTKSDLPAFLERLGIGRNQEGLYRIVYYFQNQLACYLAGLKQSGGGPLRPGQIRLPAVPESAADTLIFWSRLLESQFDKEVPILLTLPLQEAWVDATFGEPGPRECYSLRATPEVLSLTNEIPYKIDEEFRTAHQGLIQAMLVQ